jgi:3-hydroxyisobutyrate dehydrogenase-like beta-hydroxyacid dehydrogenase
MAAKLADHLSAGKAKGFQGPLLCWNRTTETSKQFASKTSGVQAVESLSELAQADVVISILANDAAADAVLDGYLAARSSDGSAAKQPVYVSCATVLPETVKRQAAAASKAGVAFVNCPVFGRPDAATAGQLIAVPAGAAAGREAIKPLLPAFAGRGTWDLGDDPASSAALKLIG